MLHVFCSTYFLGLEKPLATYKKNNLRVRAFCSYFHDTTGSSSASYFADEETEQVIL